MAIIALGGRLPQIWMNYQRGNSGELSIATCMLNLAGNLARVFTTLVLTKVGCGASYLPVVHPETDALLDLHVLLLLVFPLLIWFGSHALLQCCAKGQTAHWH